MTTDQLEIPQRKKMIKDIGKRRLNVERLLGQSQMIKHMAEFTKSIKRLGL